MESIVPEAKKEEPRTQLFEERLSALEKKLEELTQTVKELSKEKETAIPKQPQLQSHISPVPAINKPKAQVETKQDEEERNILDPKTGAIEKRRVKKAVYLEAKP